MKQIILGIPRIATAVGKKSAPTSPGNEHHTQIDGVGRGSKDLRLDPTDVLVKRALRKLARDERRAQKKLKRAGKNPKAGIATLTDGGSESSLRGSLVVPKPVKVLPAGVTTRESYTAGMILLQSADGMQELMMARMFDGFYEERFGEPRVVLAWGVFPGNMPAKKLPAVTSLARNWDRLEVSYRAALPKLTRELAKKNPKAPLMAVVQKAVELLDEQLARPLYVLTIYTESVKQVKDGRFVPELDAVEVFFQDAFRLYFTGDLHCLPDGKQAPVQLPASTYEVGAVFMPRVTSGGLATIPGARGPVGANALQLPFEMLDILMLVLPLLGHEARHNVYHDVKGTEEELLKVVEQAIRDAHTAGVIKFQNDEMTLGEQKVKTIDLIVRLFCDWLSEVDADVVGGVLFSGPAFGANMVMSFPAMMVRDGKVSEKVKLIRTNSVFSLVPQPDGNVALVFEEHPIDYIRIYLVAAALEEIGFAKQAKELRELADFAVGDELPKEVTYKEADDQTDMVIKFATADLLAVASVMVKAIIRTPLAAQLGKSCGDLVMWNAKRQAKVDVLTDILSKGSSDLPTNQGSIFATYIGAAASQAYLKLVGQGVGAVVAAKLVNNAALKMIAGLGSLAANQCPVPSQPTTQPVATTAPTKPAPTTAPTKPAPSTAPAKPARKTAPRRRKGN
jgi:hypothetical protein